MPGTPELAIHMLVQLGAAPGNGQHAAGIAPGRGVSLDVTSRAG
ncbi:MAG TPA: hypothetical protein VFY94_07960 [Rhodanobacteraceae bacterium]|jgi:hypothetical protein|nr:hypothetical protein [Rhodanobacteraceae bacterium]